MTVEIKRAGSGLNATAGSDRSAWLSIWRGALHRCPSCGQGQIYKGYLKVADNCPECGEELHHHRADDAPPYFTIFIVGHIILAGVLAMEQGYAPPAWIHAAVWVPLTLILSLALLPRIKGMLVGLQWAMRMHGFEGQRESSKEPVVHLTD